MSQSNASITNLRNMAKTMTIEELNLLIGFVALENHQDMLVDVAGEMYEEDNSGHMYCSMDSAVECLTDNIMFDEIIHGLRMAGVVQDVDYEREYGVYCTVETKRTVRVSKQ